MWPTLRGGGGGGFIRAGDIGIVVHWHGCIASDERTNIHGEQQFSQGILQESGKEKKRELLLVTLWKQVDADDFGWLVG